MRSTRKKVVTHIWGVPDSDKYLERLYDRVLRLWETAQSYGLDMLSETAAVSTARRSTTSSNFCGASPQWGSR